MKTIVLLIATQVILTAHADEVAARFVHQYQPDVKLTLYPDQCDKSNVSMGWIARAVKDTGEVASGCWRHSPDNETVEIQLDAGDNNYIDMQLFKDKFTAEYD
jgi:hypothetical protein